MFPSNINSVVINKYSLKKDFHFKIIWGNFSFTEPPSIHVNILENSILDYWIFDTFVN